MLLAKIILLLLVVYFFYRQFQQIDTRQLSKTYPSMVWPILICLALVFVNWYHELMKWSISVDYICPQTQRSVKVKSFMAGMLTGFLTPNLLGNFIGRIFYFEATKRPALIGITLFSNAAQFLASIIFGVVSLILIGLPQNLSGENELIMLIFCCLLCLIMLLCYLFVKKTPKFFLRWKWGMQINESLQTAFSLRLNLLGISLSRHFVFSIQFVLLLMAFGMGFESQNLFLVWQVYFWSTLIPSVWFGKLIIRESVALWVFSYYTHQVEVVLMASVLLWFLNQGLTALVGIPYVKLNKSRA